MNPDLNGQDILLTVEQNNVVEWSYQSEKTCRNPFREVILDVEMTTPENKKIMIPAFWTGGNTWTVRFSANETGTCRFKTICNDRKNKTLHNQPGTGKIDAYKGNNALLRQGPLTISRDKRHLEHADGTPFLWLADCWWHGMTSRFTWPDDFKFLTADRKAKGFNEIQGL